MGACAKKCKHCKVRRAYRTRGLCAVCFEEPEVRKQYPSLPNRPFKRCMECRRRKQKRNLRGLCGVCHADPKVRQRYEVSKVRQQWLESRAEKYGSVMCRHCRTTLANRPRGLCWACYYRPGVRDLYPVSSKRAAHRSEIHDFNGGYHHAAAATGFGPGSAGKAAVLAERALAGVSLFHPADSGWEANAAAVCVEPEEEPEE